MDLAWARDFMILAAQHPAEMLRFRDALEAGATYEAAAALALPPERRRSAPPAAPSNTEKLLQSMKAEKL